MVNTSINQFLDRLFKFRKNLGRLHRFIGSKGYLWLLGGFVATLGIGLIEYGIAVFIQIFLATIGLVDKDVIDPQFALLIPEKPHFLYISLIVIGAMRACFLYIHNLFPMVFSHYIILKLRFLLSEKLIPKKISLTSANSYLGDTFPVTSAFLVNSVKTVANIVQALTLLGFMYFKAPVETYISLILVAVVGVSILSLNKTMKSYAERVPKLYESVIGSFEKIIRNKFLILVSGTQKSEVNKTQKQAQNFAETVISVQKKVQAAGAFPQFAGMTSVAIIVYCSIEYSLSNPAMLLTFLYLYMRFAQLLSPIANQISGSFSQMPQLKTAIRFFEETEPELSQKIWEKSFKNLGELNVINTSLRRGSAPSITANEIKFSYPNSSKPVLKGLDINLKAGECLGIVGPSGSGKSTLLNLLLGFIEPTEGKLYINDSLPNHYLKRFNASIAYVGPDPFIFEGTLRENLTYGGIQATDEEITELLEKTKLKLRFESLSKGFDSKLNVENSIFSVGEKQRLAVVRALLRRPTLIILDEATANLDLETQDIIIELISEQKGISTVVVVSHRPELAKLFDVSITL